VRDICWLTAATSGRTSAGRSWSAMRVRSSLVRACTSRASRDKGRSAAASAMAVPHSSIASTSPSRSAALRTKRALNSCRERVLSPTWTSTLRPVLPAGARSRSRR
jgi:hypothetical protein